MTDEPNTPDTGTDNVDPEQTDTGESWDFFEPEEETEEAPEPEPTDDGTEETASEDEETPDETPAASVEFTLPDGTKVDKDELVRGYQRQADYSRKTQEIANLKQSVTARATELDGIVAAFTEHLSALMPKEPSPELALSDPNAYVRAKAQHDAAKAQVQKLIEVGSKPKAVLGTLSAEDRTAKIAEEHRKMVSMFPQAGTKDGRQKFVDAASKAALDVGYSKTELQGVMDHRMVALAHWANIGMKSVEAAKAVREKAKATPSPVKPGDAAQKVARRNPNRHKTFGSIREAARALDFD